MRGDALVHLDVRSDNVLIEPTGRVVLVDWPHACIGAPWLDLVVMLPSMALEGGGEPEELLVRSGLDAPRDAVDAVVAALAGYLHRARAVRTHRGCPPSARSSAPRARWPLRWLRTRLGDPVPQ